MSFPPESFKLLKCNACNDLLSCFPIYISENNQQICGRCSSNLEGLTIRNHTFEYLVQFMRFPCIFEKEGCVEMLLPSEVPNHEQDCSYRIISCPLECLWQGAVIDLRDHFEELHPNSIIRNGEFEIEFLSSYENYSLVIHNDELFRFKRKYNHDDAIIKYSLSCFKLLDVTTSYNYEITVYNGSRNLSLSFLPKSANTFYEDDETEVSVAQIKNELGDPSIIIGCVKIFENVATDPKEKRKNSEINFEMLNELECPVCLEYITPPIYQCVTGHSICADCKNKITACPTCTYEIKNTQNFTLEKMAYLLSYPCKYAELGCDFVSKPNLIKSHEKFCLYGPHNCPVKEYENCKWKGVIKEIYPHIVKNHFDNILDIDIVQEFVGGRYLEENIEECYIVKISEALFKLHYLFKNNVFYWAMQVIGPPETAKNYKFEIAIIDNSKGDKRLVLRNFCAPLTNSKQAFQDPNSYVYLHLDQVTSFIANELFIYKTRIIV